MKKPEKRIKEYVESTPQIDKKNGLLTFANSIQKEGQHKIKI